jgi:molybdopterin-guanine dinucleotide biosynthesis adapter protein
MKRVIGVAGFKNSGKTTLVEKLVMHLTKQGYRVSTIKHAHHSFDIDHEGRDSFRHRKAGASEVAVISKERTAIIHELRGQEPPSLAEALDKLQPCDLVIVEGYKRDSHDKIEVRDPVLNHPELAGDDPTVVAIASTTPISDAPVLVFDRDDVVSLASFIVEHCGLDRNLKIRRAIAPDAKAVRNLTRLVYAKWIASIGREPFPMTADYEAAVENHWIDLLEEDGKLLGLVEMIPRSDHLFIENLAVAENNQGGGLGTLLLRHAEDSAKAARLPEVQLATNKAFASNLTFYQKRGYELYTSWFLPDGGTGVGFRKRVS